jgi:hypothetical protein
MKYRLDHIIIIISVLTWPVRRACHDKSVSMWPPLPLLEGGPLRGAVPNCSMHHKPASAQVVLQAFIRFTYKSYLLHSSTQKALWLSLCADISGYNLLIRALQRMNITYEAPGSVIMTKYCYCLNDMSINIRTLTWPVRMA